MANIATLPIELLILEKWVLVNKCEETIDIHLSRDES